MVDLVIASSPIDLLQQIRAIDISVPLRTEGRTTEHCERWSICRFLATYAETDVLNYPLRVEHDDRPDMVLFMPDAQVGMEITEAVPANWAWADALAEQNEYDNLRFLQRFCPGEPRRPREEVDQIARGASSGDGWSGDSVEREWAEAMAFFSLDKVRKYAKSDFRKYKHNWLIIYDNWPLPAVEEDRAASLFHEWLAGLGEPLPFDKVFVECSKSIWEFSPASYFRHTINDIWVKS